MRRASRPPVSPGAGDAAIAAAETAAVLARIICRCRLRAVESDERDLVARCLTGDQRAAAELVERYSRMIGTVIWRTTGSQDDVADLTQETFLRVFRALPYFDARARLTTWIYTIAHRVTIDYLRRKGSWRHDSLRAAPGDRDAVDEETIMSPAPDPEAVLEREEHERLVRDALVELPPKYRLPLVYASIAGLDYATIGEMLRLPVGTVKTHVFRGKQLLKAAIKGKLEAPNAD
jgi:RNA polymerase sigma-70 factor (ECF subfamily)